MAKNGGYRPGAGKKKGSKASHTLEASEMRKHLIERVAKEMDPMIDAHLDLALGHWEAFTVTDENGKEKVVRAYKKAPDAAALRYLKDQTIGKATETVKITEDVTLHIDI